MIEIKTREALAGLVDGTPFIVLNKKTRVKYYGRKQRDQYLYIDLIPHSQNVLGVKHIVVYDDPCNTLFCFYALQEYDWEMILACNNLSETADLTISSSGLTTDGCIHQNIKQVHIGIGPGAEEVWVCKDCGEEI